MNSPPQIIRSTRTCLSVQDYSLISGQRQSWSAGDNYNPTPPASPTPPREKHTLELQRQLQVPPPPLRKQPQYRDLGTDSDRIHFPSVGDEVGPALPRKRPLTLRPLARRPLSRQPLSMRPLPRLPRPTPPRLAPPAHDDARLASSFVSLSCSLDGGAHFPSVGDEVGPALPRKRPLTLRPLARRPLSRQPLSMRPLPRLPRPDDARLSSSFVSLSCSLDGGAQEHVCMETDASDGGSIGSFGFLLDEDQDGGPAADDGNFLFDEDQAAEDENTHAMETDASDGGSIGSFGFLLDEDQDGGPAADDGNFLFDEDQAAEDENTHAMEVCAPAPIQVAASPLGAKDGGCLSRSPSSIMFFDHFTY
eukprot:CAMPEP_0194345448 /NCGR_PEP_ID=MMETSP0171-20130528/104857_1 /TAXON_ID=218684 /ORGANISM="Corethron pennatum, Strain L29A3" /LENGTH=362 /DNA_ID=CAMNT_0039112425 /DNA_START=71 /DNA_END=1160 /DNA_ORIENTATION=-